MRRLSIAPLLLALPLLLVTDAASAWEGYCRPVTEVGTPSTLGYLSDGEMLSSTLAGSMCEVDPARLPRCTGLAAARGVLLGEHAAITSVAMERASIPFRGRQPVVLRYYTDESVVPGTSTLSIRPADVGSMRGVPLQREFFVAELSELSDLSHSLSDFLLGNEHCFIGNVRTGAIQDLESCHQFEGHMGPINSTHWGPLAQYVYARYHRHALDIAARCREMNDAVSAAGYQHALLDDARAWIAECEQEALAFESFGLHYLEDAWSTGHMWDRWGSPNVATDMEGKLRAFLATAIVGLIHGTRSLFAYHDQLCMPGPFDPASTTEPIVRYRHGTDAMARPGGGDMYLASCAGATGENPPGNSVMGLGPEGARQLDGMVECAALGMNEVYNAGPATLGEGRVFTPSLYQFPGRAPTTAADDGCFDQRVTNESMRLGLGSRLRIPNSPDFSIDADDIAHPDFLSRAIIDGVIAMATAMGVMNLRLSTVEPRLDFIRDLLRQEVTRLAVRFIFMARRNPLGTEIADGTDPDLTTFMAIPRSSTFSSAAMGDGVPYLERTDHARWSAAPGADCVTDSDCEPGEFCDPTSTELVVPSGGAGLRTRPRCVRHEAGVLRAFRRAEVRHWCEADDENALSRAREACRVAGGLGHECEACVEVLLPHIRNGCGPDTAEDMRDGIDRRSMCEALGTASPSVVFAPYENGSADSLRRTALRICSGEDSRVLITERIVDMTGSSEGPPPAALAIDAHGAFASRSTFVCGGSPRSIWFRLRHDPGAAHEHRYGLRAFPDVRRLAVDAFLGPDCAETAPVPLTIEYSDSDSDGTPDTAAVGEPVPDGAAREICLRIRGASEEDYWQSLQFSILAGLF